SLRARDDAEAARPALVRAGGVRRLPVVRSDAQPGEPAEAPVVLGIHGAHLEHVVRAHDDAVAFGLAPAVVDDRLPGPSGRVAPRTGPVGPTGGAAPLLELIGGGHRSPLGVGEPDQAGTWDGSWGGGLQCAPAAGCTRRRPGPGGAPASGQSAHASTMNNGPALGSVAEPVSMPPRP